MTKDQQIKELEERVKRLMACLDKRRELIGAWMDLAKQLEKEKNEYRNRCNELEARSTSNLNAYQRRSDFRVIALKD